MLKVIAEKSVEQCEKFPKIMINRGKAYDKMEAFCIILFVKDRCGIILDTSENSALKHQIGKYCEWLDMSVFEDCNDYRFEILNGH